MTLLTLFTALLLTPWTLLQAQPDRPPEHPMRDRSYDVVHYRLDISVDLRRRTLEGNAVIRLVPIRPELDEICLDAAAGMAIRSVTIGGASPEFRHRSDTLRIFTGKPYSCSDTIDVSVAYSVKSPPKGLYFVVPDSGYPDRTYQAWTQGEPEDNHYWFPCYDFPNDLASSELYVTVPEGETVISNGVMAGTRRDASKKTVTWHWSEPRPHASYLISLVIGTYIDIPDSAGSVPISNYVYPSQRRTAMLSFGKTPDMIKFFSDRIGYPYPWEKYSQAVVEDFIYGGEENVSATTLTDATMHDERGHLDGTSDGLVAHELAHQWWGDLLTCRDWSHAWLNEGFATYFANVYTEHDLGRDEAARDMYDNRTLLRNADAGSRRRPTVCARYHNPMDLFDNRIYQKGAIILDMLRFVVGDEPFWKAISEYARRYAFRNVETSDFRSVVEYATGYRLDWFFNEWVTGAGYPEFDVRQSWDQTDRTAQLIVTQTQTIDSLTGLFRMPVDVEVWVHGEPAVYRVEVTGPCDTFRFPAWQEPQVILFDKGNRILKKVQYNKPLNQWLFQLTHAGEAVDRIQAIEELRWWKTDTVASVLGRIALEDPFWGVRQEAAYTLGDMGNPVSAQALVAAYGDRNARVRRAAAAALGSYSSPEVLRTLLYAFRSDSSYAVEESAFRSLLRADSLHRTDYLNEALGRPSRGELLRSSALYALASTGTDSAYNRIKTFTAYGIDRNLRVQAVHILATTWRSRDDVCDHLIGMLGDPSITVRRTVANALGIMGSRRALQPLERAARSATDERLLRVIREAIESINDHQKE